MRSINSLEVRTKLWMGKNEFKEALIVASLYENPRNYTMVYRASDIKSFAHGNLIGKLFLLQKGGYIHLEYSETSESKNNKEKHFQIDNMSLTLTGIELLNSLSFRVFSLNILKHIFLSVVVAIIVIIVLKKLGLQ